jgi:hypothetical protein
MQVKAKTVSKDTKLESPSEKIVRESRPSRTVVDSLNRSVVYRRLGVLDEAQLARKLGAELAGNPEYMRYVRIACAIQSIDGDYGVAPTKMNFIEARMEWIGDEGYIAVWNDMIEQMKGTDADSDDDDEPVDEAQELKN